MATPFLSSEEYDERAHALYNEGQYDEALTVLREGLTLYPNSVELHVGVGYAQLAREEYGWARRSFEQALVLEPEHEDGLAGLGETLLKLGQDDAALRCFQRTLELGYADDVELMLQVGRVALSRSVAPRTRARSSRPQRNFSRRRCKQVPDSAEAVACVGYAQHRLGDDECGDRVAAPLATARRRSRRSAHLSREHSLRSNRVRGSALSLRAHHARRPLGRARHLAADRTQAFGVPARGERPRAASRGTSG